MSSSLRKTPMYLVMFTCSFSRMGACRSLPAPSPQAVDLAPGSRTSGSAGRSLKPFSRQNRGHVDAGDPAEGGRVLEGVAAQAVGAVQRQAGGFAGRIQALDHRALGVPDHLGADVGRDAAHGIMGRGLDGDGFRDGVDLQVIQGQVVDLGQALQDLFPCPGGAGRGRHNPCRRCRGLR